MYSFSFLEDVQEFEKSVLEKGRGSRDQDVETSANANKSRSDSEDGASESEESQMPKRKPVRKVNSCETFLTGRLGYGKAKYHEIPR